MYSTSINPSTLLTLALLAGSSLSLPNLLRRDDTSTIKCSDDFPIQHVCKVTGEAKPLDVGNDNSDYNIIFNVYAPASKDQDKSKPWPYLANTWQQVVKNADWKKKDYELDIPAIKDGRFAGEVDGKSSIHSLSIPATALLTRSAFCSQILQQRWRQRPLPRDLQSQWPDRAGYGYLLR